MYTLDQLNTDIAGICDAIISKKWGAQKYIDELVATISDWGPDCVTHVNMQRSANIFGVPSTTKAALEYVEVLVLKNCAQWRGVRQGFTSPPQHPAHPFARIVPSPFVQQPVDHIADMHSTFQSIFGQSERIVGFVTAAQQQAEKALLQQSERHQLHIRSMQKEIDSLQQQIGAMVNAEFQRRQPGTFTFDVPAGLKLSESQLKTLDAKLTTVVEQELNTILGIAPVEEKEPVEEKVPGEEKSPVVKKVPSFEEHMQTVRWNVEAYSKTLRKPRKLQGKMTTYRAKLIDTIIERGAMTVDDFASASISIGTAFHKHMKALLDAWWFIDHDGGPGNPRYYTINPAYFERPEVVGKYKYYTTYIRFHSSDLEEIFLEFVERHLLGLPVTLRATK